MKFCDIGSTQPRIHRVLRESGPALVIWRWRGRDSFFHELGKERQEGASALCRINDAQTARRNSSSDRFGRALDASITSSTTPANSSTVKAPAAVMSSSASPG